MAELWSQQRSFLYGRVRTLQHLHPIDSSHHDRKALNITVVDWLDWRSNQIRVVSEYYYRWLRMLLVMIHNNYSYLVSPSIESTTTMAELLLRQQSFIFCDRYESSHLLQGILNPPTRTWPWPPSYQRTTPLPPHLFSIRTVAGGRREVLRVPLLDGIPHRDGFHGEVAVLEVRQVSCQDVTDEGGDEKTNEYYRQQRNHKQEKRERPPSEDDRNKSRMQSEYVWPLICIIICTSNTHSTLIPFE